jgi:hypothetical protein
VVDSEKEHGNMSYLRNMASSVSLLASSALLSLGCMVGTAESEDDLNEQADVSDNSAIGAVASTIEEGQANEDAQGEATSASAADQEKTGESKDAISIEDIRPGYGYPGVGLGGYGYPGGGYPGVGLGGYGFPGVGYRGYGYPGVGYPGVGYP